MVRNEDLSFPLTVTKDTAFHIAVHSGKVKLLKELLAIAKPFAYKIQNEYKNTALHEAASTGHVKMAKLLLDYDEKQHTLPPDEQLVEIKNTRGETPFFMAAAFGKTKMVKFLHSKVKNIITRRLTILHIAILGKYFDTALTLLEKDESLGELVDENGMTCLQVLANMPSAFKSGYPMGTLKRLLYFCLPNDDYEDDEDYDNNANKTHAPSSQREDLESGCGRIYSGQSSYDDYEDDEDYDNKANKTHAPSSQREDLESGCGRIYSGQSSYLHIHKVFPAIENLWDIKKKQKKVLKLATKLAEKDMTWRGKNLGMSPGDESIMLLKLDPDSGLGEIGHTVSKSQTSSTTETPLIAAARHGIIEIVKAILETYPQAIEHVNERNENMFHVAARYRRKEIFDLLKSPYIPKSRLRRKINVDGDSILHQAAYLGETQLRDMPGEALRMQSEIHWFKRVKRTVPTYFINHRNHKKMTAQELFTNEHKKLVDDGREWLGRTTQACTIGAVLIATVAFTSAYTVPGGSSKTGRPLLLNTTAFHVFTISDTISLCFALTSVVVFLSIMTSRMHEQDFRMSLPLKLVLGLTTLFFAVAAMMVAFSATLVLMIRQRLHWAAIPI